MAYRCFLESIKSSRVRTSSYADCCCCRRLLVTAAPPTQLDVQSAVEDAVTDSSARLRLRRRR